MVNSRNLAAKRRSHEKFNMFFHYVDFTHVFIPIHLASHELTLTAVEHPALFGQ